jgi:hypothetical protein
MIPEGEPARLTVTERELQAHGAYLRKVRGMADSMVEGHLNRLRYFLRFLKLDEHPSGLRTLRMDQSCSAGLSLTPARDLI